MTVIGADIGGTHARFAVLENGAARSIERTEVAASSGLTTALAEYYRRQGRKPGGRLALAVAARPGADGIWHFHNNNPWRIDPAALRQAGWDVEILMNDFEASAHGALTLDRDQLAVLRAGSGTSGCPRAILGPGTGLGLAFALPLPGGGWHVQQTVGGHMVAAALTEEQHTIMKLVQRLRGGAGAVVYEDMVSGRGLPVLYRAVCQYQGLEPRFADVAALFGGADDPAARITLRLFHEFLGLFAHNTAVTGHAFGGLYLDGGVIQNLQGAGLFDAAAFEAFFAPDVVPPVKDLLQATPVWLVRDAYVALRGLAALSNV